MDTRKLSVKPGDRFGRGVVIEEFKADRWSARLLCDCGTEYVATLSNLFQGRRQPTGPGARSCGCIQREWAKKRAAVYNSDPENKDKLIAYNQSPEGRARSRRTALDKPPNPRTHGLSDHVLYSTHSNMMNRCYNANLPSWEHYGGRGIVVCERWHDAETFIRDIMALLGPRPDRMSLDRRDNDGNYEPGNVRWATASQQARNQRPRRKYGR